MSTQTESGKALEYALAQELVKHLEIPLLETADKETGEKAFLSLTPQEQHKTQRAADEAITFLLGFEKKLHDGISIYLQPDVAGKYGDPRDIVIKMTDNKDIGISSKNRHFAIKHSRLSDTIDFGKEWADYPCSSAYMKAILNQTLRQVIYGTFFEDDRISYLHSLLFIMAKKSEKAVLYPSSL